MNSLPWEQLEIVVTYQSQPLFPVAFRKKAKVQTRRQLNKTKHYHHWPFSQHAWEGAQLLHMPRPCAKRDIAKCPLPAPSWYKEIDSLQGKQTRLQGKVYLFLLAVLLFSYFSSHFQVHTSLRRFQINLILFMGWFVSPTNSYVESLNPQDLRMWPC